MTSDFLALNDSETGALIYIRASEIRSITEFGTVGSVLVFSSGQSARVSQQPDTIFAQMRSIMARTAMREMHWGPSYGG